VRGRLTPFPTLYWLICPAMCRAVSHLERDGAIARIERRLAGDAELRERVARDHDGYIAQRVAALTEQERLSVEQDPALRLALIERGIGGMSSRAAVKCLHLHVAHYLVSGNAIGEIVVGELGVAMCKSERMAKPPAARTSERK